MNVTTITWLGTDAVRYVYGSGGQLLGEYDAAGNAFAEYVYMDSCP
jgi:hypothetical protein